MATLTAVHEATARTQLTCNCLLPRSRTGSAFATPDVLAACYFLNTSSGKDEDPAIAHVGSVATYADAATAGKGGGHGEKSQEPSTVVPSSQQTSSSAGASSADTEAVWGVQTHREGMPGVFDVTWTSARAFGRRDDAPGSAADGALLLASCTDGAVRLIQPTSLDVVKTYSGIHAEMITSCTPFLGPSSADGGAALHLLCTAHTGAVLVYDVTAEAVSCELEGHEFDAWCSAVMPTANTFSQEEGGEASSSQDVLLSGGDDGLLRLYDVRAGYAARSRARFDAGVVHIAPVVTTTAAAAGVEVVSAATPYVLVGSYDESVSLMDIRFMKRPVAQRAGLGGGVWRCSRCVFPFYANATSSSQCSSSLRSNYALLEAGMPVWKGEGDEIAESEVEMKSLDTSALPCNVSGVVNEQNTLLLPLMQRGAALLSYKVKAAEDEVFGTPQYFFREGDGAEETDDAKGYLTKQVVSEDTLVYDVAPLSVAKGKEKGEFNVRVATCSFYEKRIDWWTIRGAMTP